MGSIGGGGGGEQQYSLRWNDFHSSILSSFRHLRDQEDFVDVTLACDGCSFTAHKVVLSACSPYFRSLLKANPCQHPIVILRDVKEQDMEALLRFMYNGEVHIGQEHLADFLKTAQTLQVRGLADVPSKEQEKLLNNSGGMSWPSRDHMSTGLEGDSPDGGLSPPRAKRSRSQEHPPLYSPNPQHSNQDQTILSHALDPTNNNTVINNNNQLKGSDSSLAAQSTGEESNSSDTAMSCSGGDRGELVPKSEPQDYSPHGTPLAASGHPHGPLAPDSSRHSNSTPQHNFPAALLGLQGLPGLLPGPSGMHNSQENSFGRRGLELMRVRATDPRPCPKCGKIYRSAHTLRTHLEDKHTVCPGYRCVLCGTVAKSRNSLHSHMSRQHRGISTKDLPVLTMPSPFDPDLASRLLAKAGVKVSAAELRARSSPTGLPRRPDVKLEMKGSEDPEDLSLHNHQRGGFHRPPGYPSVDIRALSPPLSAPPNPLAAGAPSTGSAILDTYLQFIAENSASLHLEQAAKMATKADPRRYMDDPSEPEDDDYSEDEREPQPIKAE